MRSEFNQLYDNNINYNEYRIAVIGSDYNNISENSINYNQYGIYLYLSDNNMISLNTLKGNNNCISEIDCEGNTFRDNNCGKESSNQPNQFFVIGFIMLICGGLIGLVYVVLKLRGKKET